MNNFETRDFLAVVGILGYIAAILLGGKYAIDFTALRDIALIIIGFYFGNKSALDTPNIAAVSPAPSPCPLIVASETTAQEI